MKGSFWSGRIDLESESFQLEVMAVERDRWSHFWNCFLKSFKGSIFVWKILLHSFGEPPNCDIHAIVI